MGQVKQPRVVLISHTPEPERVVALAARLCTSAADLNELLEEISDDEAARLVRAIVRRGHLSVVEHAYFTFALEGLSRAASHQLVRHRIASYSQQSQRYVRLEGGVPHIVPSAVADDEARREVFDGALEACEQAYEKLLELGAAPEDARYVLPNATETRLLVSMNARSLLHFFELRLCRRAQEEIRRVAQLMLDQVRQVAPVLFETAGPPCETRDFCPEGPNSCGRLATLREKRRAEQ